MKKKPLMLLVSNWYKKPSARVVTEPVEVHVLADDGSVMGIPKIGLFCVQKDGIMTARRIRIEITVPDAEELIKELQAAVEQRKPEMPKKKGECVAVGFLSYICATCDHVQDEHASSGFFKPCQVKDCTCDDYAPKDEDEDEEADQDQA